MAGLSVEILDHQLPRHLHESIDQTLVMRVVNMPVEHPCFRIPLPVQVILAVIAHDRIMAQNHFPALVMQLRIGLDPYKTACVKLTVCQKAVMIPLDQIQLPVQFLKQLIGLLRISPREVPENDHLVILPDSSIPLFKHICVHLLHRREAAHIHLSVQPPVEKMRI